MARKLTILFISLLPWSRLRILAYRWLLGYSITLDSHIGWLNYINVIDCRLDKARIGNLNEISAVELRMESGASIGRLNRLKNLNRVSLGGESSISSRNRFMGTRKGISPYSDHENFLLGDRSIVVAGHHFDLSDTVSIGSNVTIGGLGTEFWTHGFDLHHVKIQAPIVIGSDVYFGSRCLVMPGVKVADQVSIAAGTTVSKSIRETGMYVSSQLVRKAEAPDFSTSKNVVVHRGARFVRRDSN